MKLKIALIIFAFATIIIFSRCYKCHPCLAEGESYALPYNSGQNVTFINDSLVEKNYTLQTSFHLPPDEYCGRVGSGSAGSCSGESNASMHENPSGSVLIDITIDAFGGRDDVERIPTKHIKVLNSDLQIIRNVGSTNDPNSSVKALNYIAINGKVYGPVYVYQKDTALASNNDCVYFAYCGSIGLLKYSIKKSNSIENWTIKN